MSSYVDIGQRIDQAKSTSEDREGEEGKASLDSTCLLHQPRSMHVQGTSIDPCCCRMMSEMGKGPLIGSDENGTGHAQRGGGEGDRILDEMYIN